MRRLTMGALALTALLVTSGCGSNGATLSPEAPTPTATATDQTTMLPRGWPSGLQLPDGTQVTSSSQDGDRLSVTFQTSELGKAVAGFLDQEITEAGFEKKNSANSGDALTVDYSDGARKLALNVVETAGDTTGSMLITGK